MTRDSVPFRTLPGRSYPLGATWDGSGVNFALFSEFAEAVELCLFHPRSRELIATIPVREQTDFVWHVYLPEARPGLHYGYRVHGPFDPARGLRFNRNKLLLDPYARAISGVVDWSDAMFGYPLDGGEDRDLETEESDSAEGMPKAVVIEPSFSWGDDVPPSIPWHNAVIYEAHVRGFTILNEQLPPEIRGTYSGLADHRTIKYLKDLGVTSVELMPVHHFIHDKQLRDRGLVNYWGYNSIGYFAPDPRYGSSSSPGQVVNEFKTMVKTLHKAGIEVILDVVYNHTAEGNQLGPTLAFRGIDNWAYYRLTGGGRYYMDYTGTGNTLNMLHPRVVQMIMDSLRYWVQEMHVDGFRFDLAATLARELHEVDRLSAFFDIIHQDPVLSQVKLIAEPWDIGEGGYQVGNFPVLWAEWNGKYRDNVRRFWKGDSAEAGELGWRLTGSSDLYASNGRRPYASINFVTAHDGFTLRDLVSYNEKHNEANGEDNNDGSDDNQSWNCGAEGATDDPEINELRARQQRNFLTTLFISQGVPMLLHGDEVGRTQQGNNNGYCQDNEITWQSWDHGPEQEALLDWTRRVIALRKRHPILRRRNYFLGRQIRGLGMKDLVWLAPNGHEMTEAAWHDPETRTLGMVLAGPATDITDDEGRRVVDDTLVILMNADPEEMHFRLPPTLGGARWSLVLDTARPEEAEDSRQFRSRSVYTLKPRSMAILRQPLKRTHGA
ncbi:MAG: glycogen debranching protein GlgX [Dehalococcoidia bacterium]|nr:glycogen debranching protein GlgX [Dehalococcoidia bacterium]